MISDTNQASQLPQTAVTGSRFIPMLFSTPMVEAIDIHKTKTETRRTQGLEKINETPYLFRYDGFEKELGYHYFERLNNDKKPLEKYEPIKSKVNVGDIIWVRETFCPITQKDNSIKYHYKASNWAILEALKVFWKPSLFMPKEACRLFLKVVSVHAERLQDIDEQGAINEGIERLKPDGLLSYRSYAVKYDACVFPIVSYQTLWQKINGFNSWNKNPFVWVYKFEVVERPHDFL
jgi:hypothetical protein